MGAINRLRGGLLLATILAISSSMSVSAQTKPPDWRVFGFTKKYGQDFEEFYLVTEIRRNASGHIEVWTKGLSTQAIDAFNATKEQIAAAAKKLVTANVSVPALYQKATTDQLTGMAIGEVIANSGEVEPTTRMLFEIDCSGRVYRLLSGWVNYHGKTNSSDTASTWMHAAPETNISTLMNALCPAS